MEMPGSPLAYVPGTVFADWREHQKETVAWAVDEFERGRKFVAFDGPTGYGKSLTAVMTGKLLRAQTLYVVHSKQLQDQLAKDFPDCAVLKGRANYSCKGYHGLTCDLCGHEPSNPCEFAGIPEYDGDRFIGWREFPRCNYKVAKLEALQAPLVVVNYALLLAEANYVGLLSNWPLIVLDEADMADGCVTSHVTLDITRNALEYYEIDPPDDTTSLASWEAWVDGALIRLDDEYHKHATKIDEARLLLVEPSKNSIDGLKKVKTLIEKIKAFQAWVDEDWVLDGDDENSTWIFKPKWADKIAERILMRHSSRILAMSGTMPLPKYWGSDLGIDPEEIAFREIESTFPVENRPVIVKNVVMMTYSPSKEGRYEKYEKLVEAIDDILDRHSGDKGIVHTISNELRDYIMNNSRHGDRMISHSTKDRGRVAEDFMASREPLALVSPSFSRGLDLKYDRGRFQIICKLPYASLGDLQTRERANDGQRGSDWYKGMAARDLVQMAGRIVRAKDDWGRTYILDGRFWTFYKNNLRFFPKHFKLAVTLVDR